MTFSGFFLLLLLLFLLGMTKTVMSVDENLLESSTLTKGFRIRPPGKRDI